MSQNFNFFDFDEPADMGSRQSVKALRDQERKDIEKLEGLQNRKDSDSDMSDQMNQDIESLLKE